MSRWSANRRPATRIERIPKVGCKARRTARGAPDAMTHEAARRELANRAMKTHCDSTIDTP
jgi:hypothetical protein